MSRPEPAWLKPVTDYVPLALFLAAFFWKGMMAATAVMIVATLVVLALNLLVLRRVPMMPLVCALIVGVFGGLTLWLQDDSFIKMKPTIIYALFSLVLGWGLWFRRPVLQSMMGLALSMDDLGWRILSWRFFLFFGALAGANEIVRRILTTEQWVLWKFPGCLILLFVFMLAQSRLIQRHGVETPKQGD